MKNLVLAILLTTAATVAFANDEAACKAAHEEAMKAGNKELADKIEAAMKAGEFAKCVEAK